MATRRTKVAASRKSTATKSKTKRAAKTSRPRKAPARKSASKVTLASIAAQLQELSEKVDALAQMVRAHGSASPSPRSVSVREFSPPVSAPLEDAVDGALMAIDVAKFEADLLETLSELDRRGRHSGMVPIPEVRQAFVERGWSRRAFDARLLQAERDFVVDLKTANDPARLDAPELAIEEPGRGHLQYVVLR